MYCYMLLIGIHTLLDKLVEGCKGLTGPSCKRALSSDQKRRAKTCAAQVRERERVREEEKGGLMGELKTLKSSSKTLRSQAESIEALRGMKLEEGQVRGADLDMCGSSARVSAVWSERVCVVLERVCICIYTFLQYSEIYDIHTLCRREREQSEGRRCRSRARGRRHCRVRRNGMRAAGRLGEEETEAEAEGRMK